MKNLILGTTALVAATALTAGVASAAEKKEVQPIKLGVSGYLQTSFVAASYDAGDQLPTDIRHEGEIHFTGSTTLDNGLTFGVNIQLEARQSTDQVDETFMYVQGSFGRVVMGSENSASYLMHYDSPSPVPAWGLDSPNAEASGMATVSTYTTRISDADKITYFTPRFSGFQLGASYTPDSDGETAGGKVYSAIADEGTADEGYSIGANYIGNFNEVSVKASAGYEVVTRSASLEDSDEITVGTQIGFSGFTVGAAYKFSQDVSGVSDADEHYWSAGVKYGQGPWTIGLQYAGLALDDASGDGEQHGFLVGGSYILGPGITAFGGIQHWQAEDDLVSADTGEDATIFFVGTALSF